MFRPVEGVALARALGAEGIEGFQEEISGRDVAGSQGKGADAVEVAVRYPLRAVAAEEGAVFEVLVVRKGIPAAGTLRIRLTHVDAGHPEGRRRAAAGIASVGIAAAMEIAARSSAVDPPVEGQIGCAELVLGADAEDIGNVHFLIIIPPAAGYFFHARLVIAFAHGAEIPGLESQLVAHFLPHLYEGGPVDGRAAVLLSY
ncbi:hypothetical protein SAMN05660900_00460 [Megasphaera cerevisiae DSM 20462]|nr:hypothetical protein SAMN05660900_00460 [Megasphaera cerevisiae DSM 20462]